MNDGIPSNCFKYNWPGNHSNVSDKSVTVLGTVKLTCNKETLIGLSKNACTSLNRRRNRSGRNGWFKILDAYIVQGDWCIGARRLDGLLAFSFALEVVPLVFRLVAALSYIIHQCSDDVGLFHCTRPKTLIYKLSQLCTKHLANTYVHPPSEFIR